MKRMLVIIFMLGLFPATGCQQKSWQNAAAQEDAGQETAEQYSAMQKQELVDPIQKSSHPTSRKKTAKPGAAVSLASPNLITISKNTVSNINVLLKAQADSGVIHVELNSSDGLQMLSGEKVHEIHVNSDGYYHLPLSVQASNDGRYYLKLHVKIDNGEYAVSRGLAVIIQVGPLAEGSRLSSTLRKSNTSENIISLPAQENITNH